MRSFFALIILYSIISGSSALSLNDIQGDVICTCGCGKILENCDCGTAESMREEINSMILSGKNRQEIIKELQSMYGREVLANPPKEGVFIGLWYYPVFVVLIGAIIVYAILKRRDTEWYGDPDETINQDEFELEH